MIVVLLLSLIAPVALIVLVPAAFFLSPLFTAAGHRLSEQSASKTSSPNPRIVPQRAASAYLPTVAFLLLVVLGCAAALPYCNALGETGPSPESVSRIDPAERDKDIEDGRRLVHESGRLSCIDCHAFQRGDASSMLNLFDVGRRLSGKELAMAVRTPSQSIHADFPTDRLTTSDGRQFEGRILVDDGNRLLLRGTSSHEISVAHTEIEDRESLPSPMPEGQADGLTSEEFEKLVAYLMTLRG